MPSSPSQPGRLLSLLLFATFGTLGCSGSRQASPRPDVLLLVIDCLRADHVGAYGYPLETTPNIDRLAEGGIVFEHAYSNATWTKPSMATLFTGLHPTEHGLLGIGVQADDGILTDALPDGTPMLAERFAGAGYHTIAVVRQVHLKPEFGFGRGFSRYRSLDRGSASDQRSSFFKALDDAPRDRPYFAWIHFLEAHWPYRPPEGREEGPFGRLVIDPEPPLEQGRAEIDAWVRDHLDEENRRALMARYDGEIASVDAEVGRLLNRLDAAGRLDNTLVIVTADHGEGFNEHGHLMHGFAPYEEVARVPLVVRPPRSLPLPPGRRSTPVSHAGLAATLLDLLGLPPLPGGSEGSYAEVWLGREAPEREILVQTELAAALRRGRQKLILFANGRRELYDLAADPAERLNLATKGCSGACRELESALRRRIQALAKPGPLGEARHAPEDNELLRALGYL